jgi:hypothetical protein
MTPVSGSPQDPRDGGLRGVPAGGDVASSVTADFRVRGGAVLPMLRLLLPFLVRALPTGCYVAAPPSRRHPAWVGPARWATAPGPVLGRGPTPAAPALTSMAVGPFAVAPVARLGDEEVGPWDRAAVRASRLSAWRHARPSSAPFLPEGPLSHRATAAPADPIPAPSHLPRRPQAGDLSPTTPSIRSLPTGDHLGASDVDLPIDVVYTWVDDHDPAWRRRYAEMLREHVGDGDAEATGPARYHNRDELRYSLRSLAAFAPWVRQVHVVTAGQVPAWLQAEAPHVRIVPHEEILDPDCLPTFNSHAIESRLHRIPGLAEHYLYFNDDFFLGRPCAPSTFFTPDGRPRMFPDQQAMVPDGRSCPADRPVDSASKNTRDLMADEFGLTVRHKMQHAPYPQRRDILFEMEERFPLAFKRTARNPFRHHTDVNIPSCLSHYYGLATGVAVPSRIPASYINIGNPWAGLTMRRLLARGGRDVFCLNDTPMSARRRRGVDATVRSFLEVYFPQPAPCEADQPTASRQKVSMSAKP